MLSRANEKGANDPWIVSTILAYHVDGGRGSRRAVGPPAVAGGDAPMGEELVRRSRLWAEAQMLAHVTTP